MTRLLPALAAVLLFLPAGSTSPAATFPLPPEKDRWIRVDTAHFSLFSNAAEGRTTEIGLRLEAMREVLGRMLPELHVDSRRPLRVFVFKDNASFAPYKSRSAIAPDRMAGSFAKQRDAGYLALNAGRPLDRWRVVHHEYFHYFLSNNFTEVPLWFSEGSAECFSTLEIDEARVEIGRPPDNYILRLRKNPWIPFGDLVRIDASSEEFKQIRSSMAFYAESWVLAHYLLWGNAHGEPRGIRFLGKYPPGSSLAEGLERLLGSDWGGLESRVAEYVRNGRPRPTVTVLKDLKIDTSFRATPMGRAEVLQRLGDFLVLSDLGREEQAEAHFREALRIDPALAGACIGLGLVSDARKRFDQAAAFFERAIALDPGDPMARLYYGDSLLKSDAGRGPMYRFAVATPPVVLLAREQFRQALRLRPDLADAYAGFGNTYLREVGPVTEGIEAMEKALPLLPGRSDVVLNLAALHARNGDRDRARAVMEPLLSRSKDPAIIELGRETLLQADYSKARSKMIQGDIEGSVALFKAILAQTHDPVMKDTLALQLAEIERTTEAGRQVGIYNQAVDLANRGDFRKAAEILEGLLGEATDPDVIGNAKTLLKRIRQTTQDSRPR